MNQKIKIKIAGPTFKTGYIEPQRGYKGKETGYLKVSINRRDEIIKIAKLLNKPLLHYNLETTCNGPGTFLDPDLIGDYKEIIKYNRLVVIDGKTIYTYEFNDHNKKSKRWKNDKSESNR